MFIDIRINAAMHFTNVNGTQRTVIPNSWKSEGQHFCYRPMTLSHEQSRR